MRTPTTVICWKIERVRGAGDDPHGPANERQIARAPAWQTPKSEQPLADAIAQQRRADDQPEDELGALAVSEQVDASENEDGAFADQHPPVGAAPGRDSIGGRIQYAHHRGPSLMGAPRFRPVSS